MKDGLGIYAVTCVLEYAGATHTLTLKTYAEDGEVAIQRAHRHARRHKYTWRGLRGLQLLPGTQADF